MRRPILLCTLAAMMLVLPSVHADEARGLQRAEQHQMFAKFALDASGNVTGRFSNFHYANASGAIHDFKAGADKLAFFSAIEPTPFTSGVGPSVHGARFRANGTEWGIRAHNNPTALLGWHAMADGTSLKFTLASGATVATKEDKQIRINTGQGHGHILYNGPGTITNTSTTVTIAMSRGETVLFMAHPGQGPFGQFLHKLNALIVAKRLGAVTNIAGDDGQAVLDNLELDVNVTVTRIGPGKLTIVARGEATTPRVLVFLVDPDTLPGQRAEKIRARLNDQPIENATSEQDVDGGSDARVFIVKGQQMAAILVKLPHFSTQTLTFDEEGGGTTTSPGGTTSPTKTGTPGFEAIAMVAALGALLLLRRRR